MTTPAPEPVATYAYAPLPVERAPEGTKPGTVWFWLLAFTPLLDMVILVPTAFYFQELVNINPSDVRALSSVISSPALAILSILDLVLYVTAILFPVLDWRELDKRGVPHPFHWAFSLFALVIGGPIVYVIGRTVVVKRRTGKGLAPLWVFVGLGAVYFISGFVVFAIYAIELINEFTSYLATGAGSVL